MYKHNTSVEYIIKLELYWRCRDMYQTQYKCRIHNKLELYKEIETCQVTTITLTNTNTTHELMYRYQTTKISAW